MLNLPPCHLCSVAAFGSRILLCGLPYSIKRGFVFVHRVTKKMNSEIKSRIVQSCIAGHCILLYCVYCWILLLFVPLYCALLNLACIAIVPHYQKKPEIIKAVIQWASSSSLCPFVFIGLLFNLTSLCAHLLFCTFIFGLATK